MGQIPGHSETFNTSDAEPLEGIQQPEQTDRDDLAIVLAVSAALQAADLQQLTDIYNRLNEARQAELLATAITLVEAQATEDATTPSPKSAT
ncbi:hypothetical protein [Rosistilla oblonga]|uniref:hypothetical protein n=1 Tax=Rosistilla oblonga TaxID=2527990 RepID=UPI003A98061F